MTSTCDLLIHKFITENTAEKRKQVSAKLRKEHPGHIPIIIGRSETVNTPAISKNKFLAPQDITFSKFAYELRKNIINLNKSMSLFFFIGNNTLVPSSALMGHLYNKYKDNDGFLYITYSSENTFDKHE